MIINTTTKQNQTACACCGCTITKAARRYTDIRPHPAEHDYLDAGDRFRRDAAHHPARLMSPMMRVGGALVRCTWEKALSVIAANLKAIKNRRGPESIGGLGSVRTTNEDDYLFQKFMRTVIGTNNVDMLARRNIGKGLNAFFFSGELAMLGEHDVILVLDKNAGEINPLTGVVIENAVNSKGKRLVIVSDGPNKFTKMASVVIRSGIEEKTVTGVLKALGSAIEETEERKDVVSQAARLLRAAESVAIIVPSKPSQNEYDGIRELADRLKNVTYYPLVGPGNLQGGLDMGVMPDYYPGYQRPGPYSRMMFGKAWNTILSDAAGMNAIEMMRSIGAGGIAALYVMGDDPVRGAPDIGSLLEKLDFLVVQDILLTETAGIADVVLPAASFLEKTGTFTSHERRLRLFTRAAEPAGESMPDWKIIQSLANRMGAAMNYSSAVEIMSEIKSTVPMYRDLAIDACWRRERSPLDGTDADLSLVPGPLVHGEAFAAGNFFSLEALRARTKELKPVTRAKG